MNCDEEIRPPYFYVLGYDQDELELAQAEVLTLASGERVHPRIVLSDQRIELERTGYVSFVGSFLARGGSVEELAAAVRAQRLVADAFRIHVKKIPKGLPLKSHELAGRLALEIGGHPNLDVPQVEFLAVATEQGLWFGRLLPIGEPRWKRLHDKPYEFSSALPARMARALVNLGARAGQRITDPCCGSGTLLLHAADLGASVSGWDINPRMVWMTRGNLQHFGLPGEVQLGDAASVEGRFDAVVTNLPYGNFCAITPEKYRAILANCRRLAPQQLFVTTSPSDELLRELGFRVERRVLTGEKLARRIVYCCSSA